MGAPPKNLRFLWMLLLILAHSAAAAEEWSRAYTNSLPDAAFTAIEKTADGKTVRHLPHHDQKGALDIPHLKSALARLKQVKWTDPSNEAKAREHLEQHWREYQEKKSKSHGSP